MHFMKKLLAVLLILATTVVLISCNTPDTDELVGTYELSELTGTLTYDDTEYQLDKDAYEYYYIILREGGTALIRSKSIFTMSDSTVEGTWKYSFGSVKITGKKEGNTITEKLYFDDGVLTCNTNVSDEGSTLKMKLTFTKTDA